jgi:NAD(P)-dependent dehydrogenase (short-subunit alcohol dehydrogenase family)
VGRLEARRALVTGAGQGIGRAIALAFVREGAAVVVADIQADTAARTAAEIEALGGASLALEADVGRASDCERIVRESNAALGGLDILVNAAAWAEVGVPIAETDDELYQRTLDVCMSSVFWTMRAAHPFLKQSGRGSVINFASNAGTEGMPFNSPYAAAKEAIRGFSRSAAREWAADGIRVNMIRPIADSPSLLAWGEANPEQKRVSAARIPLGRFGDCELDIAPVAVFLASDEARYVTAVTLPADGGGGMER